MALSVTARPPQRGTSQEGRNRKYCFRVRQRYGGRVGKSKVREKVPVAVALTKVCSSLLLVKIGWAQRV